MGTGGHAVTRGVKAHTDVQSLLVASAGPIGVDVLAMAKIILGQDFPVLISDMVPYRLALAEKLGGLPIDIAIDTSGVTLARRGAVDVLARRGVLVCVGHGGELGEAYNVFTQKSSGKVVVVQ